VGDADTETQTSGFTRIKQGLAYLVKHEPSADVVAGVYRVEVFDAVTAALPRQGVEVDAVGDAEVLKGTK
jgi:hypothetical protein